MQFFLLAPFVALEAVIAGVAVREGLETWRGEECFAVPNGHAPAPSHDDCCD